MYTRMARCDRERDDNVNFRKRKGINLSYEQQGYIAFTCWTYEQQPEEMRHKILNLCTICGGDHRAALFDAMTRSDLSITQIAMKHHIDATTIYRIRKRFYESWE